MRTWIHELEPDLSTLALAAFVEMVHASSSSRHRAVVSVFMGL
jgi:hypothetical protein